MVGFFNRGPTPPARVPTDKVIPVHFWDDNPLFRRITLYNTFIFDDVLDPEKLRGSLARLVQHETWRKLGGRLRKDDNGGLEYHIPKEFTQDRPAVGFTHVVHNMNIEDHPLASRLPKPSKYPAIVGDPDEFISLAQGPDCPSSIDDWLYTDRPMLGLHVVSFRNATLVTLHWLHMACDAIGQKGLVGSWVLELQGRGDEVVAQQGSDYDPMRDLGKHPTEPFKLADQKMSALTMASYVFRNGYSLTVGEKENRMVCIPAAFWQKWLADAKEELKREGDPVPFVTENDVLLAFWARVACSHLPRDSEKQIAVQEVFSLRKALEKDLLPKGKPFVSNCFGYTTLLIPAKDILQKPIGWLAIRLRQLLLEQGTREQVEAYHAMMRDAVAKLPIFFGEGTMHQVSWSNWQKAGLFDMDFSEAAVTPRDSPLYPSNILHAQIPFHFPEGFIVPGRDQQNNYWLVGYRVKGMWAKIEEVLSSMTDVELN